MTTLEPGALLPDALAAKLAGHYSPDANGPLATLRWTGRVLPGTAREVEHLQHRGQHTTASGQRDPQAVAAEMRALAHYARVHAGRGEVDGWRDWTPAKGDEAAMVVPGAWREPAEPVPTDEEARAERKAAAIGARQHAFDLLASTRVPLGRAAGEPPPASTDELAQRLGLTEHAAAKLRPLPGSNQSSSTMTGA